MENKKYIKPEIKAYDIFIGQHLLAGSDTTLKVDNTGSGTSATNSLSRDNGDMWNDDDDE